jgi:hypothetical protein
VWSELPHAIPVLGDESDVDRTIGAIDQSSQHAIVESGIDAVDGLFIANAKFRSLRDCQGSTSVRKNDPFVEPMPISQIVCQQSGLSGSKKWFPQSKFSFQVSPSFSR